MSYEARAKSEARRKAEAVLCGVQEHEDLLVDRDATLAVLTDLIQERGLTDIVELLRATKECIEPLSELLRMVVRYDWDEQGADAQELPASLYRNGELFRRIMDLQEALKSPRFEALASARR